MLDPLIMSQMAAVPEMREIAELAREKIERAIQRLTEEPS